jgi:inner membrane protein
MPLLFWTVAAALAILPDIDILAFNLGIPYDDPLGHRGFTHSLFFAFVASAAATLLTLKQFAVLRWWSLWAFFFLATAAHGFLDAFTDGGRGIAFFAPFDNTRYFFPWQPILVPPIGVRPFLSEWGLHVLLSELLWVWLPTGVVVGAVEVYRRTRDGRPDGPTRQ